jgi:hypothetical protein
VGRVDGRRVADVNAHVRQWLFDPRPGDDDLGAGIVRGGEPEEFGAAGFLHGDR